MATLTICLNQDGTYSVTETEPVVVPLNGKLDVTVPPGGCHLCFDEDFKGTKRLPVPENQQIDMQEEPEGRTWHYHIVPPTETASPAMMEVAAHSIQIGN